MIEVRAVTSHAAIHAKWPEKFNIFGTGVDAKIEGTTIPTQTAIDTAETEWAAELVSTQYRKDRKAVFLSFGDQLDQLFHDIEAGKLDETGEWYKAIAKVKSDHPKPG
jgi:4-hydroxyphenylpyruvate dioxygenase-like putative hemolysin